MGQLPHEGTLLPELGEMKPPSVSGHIVVRSFPWQVTLLAFLDSTAVFGSFFVAYWFRNGLIYDWALLRYSWTANHIVFLCVFAIVQTLLFRYIGLYKPYLYSGSIRHLFALAKAVVVLGFALIGLAYYGRVSLLLESRILLTAFIAMLFVLMVFLRLIVFRLLCRKILLGSPWSRGVLVVSEPDIAQAIGAHLEKSFPGQKDVRGYLRLEDEQGEGGDDLRLLGKSSDFRGILQKERIHEVYLVTGPERLSDALEIIDLALKSRVEIYVNSSAFGPAGERVPSTFFAADRRFISFNPNWTGTLERWIKRAFDIAVSVMLLACGWVVILLFSWLIRRESPGPAIFRQERAGKGGRSFTVLKFRTMWNDTTPEHHQSAVKAFARGDTSFFATNGVREEGEVLSKLASEDRVTPTGVFLRRSSLDEIPQIVNVLRGEMSLVGPRPVPIYELEEYQTWHYKRLNMRPGITGLWQVSDRSKSTFEGMMFLDAYYVLNWSLLLDLQILLRTIPAVASGRGSY